jgi:hypothetical protein
LGSKEKRGWGLLYYSEGVGAFVWYYFFINTPSVHVYSSYRGSSSSIENGAGMIGGSRGIKHGLHDNPFLSLLSWLPGRARGQTKLYYTRGDVRYNGMKRTKPAQQ